MFPLRDNIPSARYPVTTVSLIVVNVLVFFWGSGSCSSSSTAR
jgi:hypothetical protein